MATNNIKGLTIEIGGDTTKLGKALDDVDKKSRSLSGELGNINRLLKMDPGNADLLAQKQKVLAEAVENTSKRLETLKEAERQVQAQFERGEASAEQMRELQREVIATTKKLEGYERAAKETADAVDNLGKKSKEASEQTAAVNNKLAGGLAKGLGGVATAAGAAVTALAATAESTREYRTEMGKLDTAFATVGLSSATATDTYRTLQSVIGETDQSVEAAQQIALLANSEKDAATWADLAAGAVGRFGAALQPETFFEAANETIKLGEATGAYTKMLEGCGYSVDKFNEGLAACSTEEEKQAYMLGITDQLLGEASASYQQTNADVIAANEANEKWAAGMAEVGAFMEPVMTQVKSLGADLLGMVVPAIQAITNNLPAIGAALAGVTAAMVAFKVAALAATAASKGMTLAQYAMTAAQTALNVVLNANPIGLIILAITALVTAFMLLWNNCEGFRNFWINLWENIKNGASAAIDAVVGFFTTLPERISTWLTTAITNVSTWATNMATKAREMGKNFINGVVNFFKNLPERVGYFIGAALGTVASWAVNMAKKAAEMGKNFITSVVNFFATLPSRVASFLSSALSKVTGWARDLVSKGKTAASDLVAAVVNGIKSLPSKLASIGKDLVKGLWNGITGAGSWLKSKISNFASSILKGFKDKFKINSPSKETEWMGEMLDEGLAEGVERNAQHPIRAMQAVSGGVLDAAASEVGGIGFDRTMQQTRTARTAQAVAASGWVNMDAMLAKLDSIYNRLDRLQVVMETGTLVGAIAEKMDGALAERQLLTARGV